MSEYVKYIKDPEALLDYSINWADFLDPIADIIVDSAWTHSADLTLENETFADDSTTIWLSGGTLGNVYPVINHITTSDGREDDRTFHLQIEEQ